MTQYTIVLGELFEIGSSKRVFQSQWANSGVPFYRGREITRLSVDGYVDNELFISEDLFKEFSNKYGMPSPGDIMITAIGTIGNSYIVRAGDRFYFKDASVLWLKKLQSVSSNFINYWLKSPWFFDQLERGNGATVDTLTIQKLKSVVVDLPPPEEQQRIVSILDEAFEGIATAKANAEKNLQNARELFENQLESIFYGNSNHWPVKTLESVCGFQNGFAFKSSLYKPKGIPILRISNLQDDEVDLEGLVYVDPEDYRENLDRFRIVRGDLLIAMSGATIGKLGFNNHDQTFLLNQRVGKFEPGIRLQKRFLYYFLSTKVKENLRISVGAAQPNLSTEQIRGFLIPVPSLDSQAQVVESLDTIREQTLRLEVIYQQKITSLDELKQSLLHRAFSGDL